MGWGWGWLVLVTAVSGRGCGAQRVAHEGEGWVALHDLHLQQVDVGGRDLPQHTQVSHRAGEHQAAERRPQPQRPGVGAVGALGQVLELVEVALDEPAQALDVL